MLFVVCDREMDVRSLHDLPFTKLPASRIPAKTATIGAKLPANRDDLVIVVPTLRRNVRPDFSGSSIDDCCTGNGIWDVERVMREE